MAQTFDEIKQRIKDLKARSGRGSITVAETFNIIDELLEKTRYVDINQGSLTIKVVYATVAEMMADTEPRDQNGRLLKYGQLACIATGDESEDNGKVYSFQNPGWLFVDRIGDYNGFIRKEKIAQGLGKNADMVISQASVTNELNERVYVLPYYGEDVPDYIYNDTDTASGAGKVYYDSSIKQFVSIEGKTGYKYWGGNYPHNAYSINGDGVMSKSSRLYFNPEKNKVYFGGISDEPLIYNTIHNALGNSEDAVSQKTVTEAFNILASKIVDAKDILPFDGFEYESNYPNKSVAVGTGEGDVYYDDAEFRFFKIIDNVLYHSWDGEYPHTSYSLDGSTFRMDKVYVNIDDKKSYTGSMDGTPILIGNVLAVYQTLGTSTTGTISQNFLTKKFDTIDKGIFQDLGVFGENFDSLDDITSNGTYQYSIKGPLMPGKPQVTYNYRLFVMDGYQIQIGGSGILSRRYENGAWSDWDEAGGGSGAGNVFNVDKFIPLEEGSYTLATAVEAVMNYKNGKFMAVGLIITYRDVTGSFKSWQFNGEAVSQFDTIDLWSVFGGDDRVKRIFVNGEEKLNVNGTVDINLPIPEVDEFLDEQSTNTIQNKVVAKKFDSLGDNMLKDVDIIPDEANSIVTLNFMNTKDQLITSVDIPAIGGSGGGDGSAVTRIALSAKLAEDEMKKGDSNLLTYSYAHTYVGGEEDGQPTGTRATIAIKVKSGIEVLAEYTENNVAQGNYTYELPADLPAGVIDVYVVATAKDPINPDKTQKRTAYATTRVYDLSLKSSFDLRTNMTTALNANGMVTIPYSITGAGNKTIKLHLNGNGNAYESQTITDSGTTNSSFQVNLGDSKLQSGRHNVQIIAEITTSTGKVIKSNLLYIDLYKPYASSVTTKRPFVGIKHSFNRDMFVSYEYQTPVFDFKQYEETAIEYIVYKEDSPTVPLSITENGNVVQSSVAAREVYTYLNRYTGTGTFNNVISAGSGNVITEYEYQVVIGKSDVNIEEVTDSMVLKLIAAGRSNNESESARNKWTYGDITTDFFGFDWKLNGWIGNKLVMNNGASINLNYKPFTTESLATGKTLEFELLTSNIFDKDALILSCMQQAGENLIGFDMTTREARLVTKGGSVIATKFAPDMNLRICFVIESKEQNRMLMLYVNGICCGAVQYAQSDSLMHDAPALPISINSVPCDVAISCIRVYNRALTADELLRNYIADRTNSTEMTSVFKRNDILDETGEKIDMTKLVSQGKAVMMITGDLTWLDANNSKKTKIKCDFTLWDHKGDILTGTNAGVSLQGTSSMLYPRKNYRVYFNEFDDTAISLNGESVPTKGYSIRPHSRPVGLFCLKADFAESSGTHNTGVACIVNDSWKDCGFLTPPQKSNKDDYEVRIGVDGFPISLFHRKDANSTPVFIGHYNFNNDKAESEVVFGFKDVPEYNDEETLAGKENPCICLEMLNNTGDICNFRTNDLSKFDDDLEFRFPDQKSNEASEAQMAKIQELWDWVLSCKDKPAKFKDEYQSYFDKNSLLAWYIYTEYFMALDQRVKNTMLATWGDKWYYIPYDNDTVLGVHNKGELVYDYDIDETSLDPLGGEDNVIYAFMGHDSVLWNLVRSKEMYDDLASVAKKIRDKMTTPYVLQVLNDIQMGEWAERVYNKDADWKYIVPATKGVENLSGELVKYNYISSLQGSRYAHRTYIVRNRFALMDSKYVAGEFAGDEVGYRLHNDFATNPGRVWLKPTEKFFFAHGINSNVVEGALLPKEDGRVEMKLTSAYTQNDPAKIFGASKILELDLQNVAKYLISGINFNKCKNMVKLSMNSCNDVETIYNTGLNTINMSGCINLREMYMDGMMNDSLKTLDLSDCRKLTHLVAGITKLTSIQFADGVNPEHLTLPATLQALELKSSKISLGNIRYYDENGWDKLERIVFESCPNMDWVEMATKCNNLQFMRITDIYTYGNGNVLTDIMNRKIGGVDNYGSNITGKCYLLGTYQLTQEVSESQLTTWKAYFVDLNILQPQYTTLEIDMELRVPDSVSNLQNMTGAKYGTAIELSGSLKSIFERRHRYLCKYSSVLGTMRVCQLDDNNSLKFHDGSEAKSDGSMGETFVYEPHYWYKGVNDFINGKQYHLYAFSEEAPSPKATYKKYFKSDLSITEGAALKNVTVGSNIQNLTVVDATEYSVCEINIPDGYDTVRFPFVRLMSKNTEYSYAICTEDGLVIQSHPMPGNVNLLDGMYIVADIPKGYTSLRLLFTIRTVAEFDFVLFIKDAKDRIEAIEPDWVEHEEYMMGAYPVTMGGTNNLEPKSVSKQGVASNYLCATFNNVTSIETTCKSKGIGFGPFTYSEFKDIGNLFMAAHGTKDSRSSIGNGSWMNNYRPGLSESQGMRSTITKNTVYPDLPINGHQINSIFEELTETHNSPVTPACALGYEGLHGGMRFPIIGITWSINGDEKVDTGVAKSVKSVSYQNDLIQSIRPSYGFGGYWMLHTYNGKYMDVMSCANIASTDKFPNFLPNSSSTYANNGFYTGGELTYGSVLGVNLFDPASNYLQVTAARLVYRGKIEHVMNIELFKAL